MSSAIIDSLACKDCDKQFSSFIQLRKHRASSHLKQGFKCRLCKKVFLEEQNLKHHIKRVHSERGKFRCAQCSQEFSYKDKLSNHIRSHHGETIKCNECDRTFKWTSSLLLHMRTIHRGSRFECKHCGKKCAQRGNLLSHIKNKHHKNVCERETGVETFARKINLDKNVKTPHLNVTEVKWPSKVSENRPSRIAKTDNQIDSHKGAKATSVLMEFNCDVCDFSYSRESNLKIHMEELHSDAGSDCGRGHYIFNKTELRNDPYLKRLIVPLKMMFQ